MCASLDRHIYDNERDAMEAGNDMARDAAEKMREADQQDQADQQIEEARDSIEELRGSIQRVLEDRRKAQAPESLCEVLRSWVRSQLAEIRALRKRIALLEREPWQAVV